MQEVKRRLPDWFKKMDPRPLARAIVTTFKSFGESGEDASAEKWTSNTRKYRPILFDLVIKHWCEETGLPDDQFPFNEDAVAQCYMYWRKAGPEDKALLEKLFDWGEI